MTTDTQGVDNQPPVGYDNSVHKEDTMRRYKVEFVIEVADVDPEDWITESIVDQLDDGETIEYLNVSQLTPTTV